MSFNYNLLKNEEKAVFALRNLYEKYGYSQYKMNKFEEYDLYVRNKDFLVSDNIITFTDTDGKLMALKPDVTLSIIKNGLDHKGFVSKVYYNENVYRVSKGTHSYKEIMQVGLECIGDTDSYCTYEVITLAAESLNYISENFVLDISHMGIVSGIINHLGISGDYEKRILKYIGEKNVHSIDEICTELDVDSAILKKLVTSYGNYKKVIPFLKDLDIDECKDSIKEILDFTQLIENTPYEDKINIDFSVINDMNYYNGFVFKGFVNGISEGILSGGQYDKLMKKMKRSSRAIGFAVYLDMLERFETSVSSYDVDTIILYEENCDIKKLNNAINMLTDNGKTVMAQRKVPDKIRYKQLLRLNDKGVEIIETNA